MLNPPAVYLRILHTYWARVRSSWSSMLFLMAAFVWVGLSIASPRRAVDWLPFVLMAVMFLGGAMWIHLREQLASDRRRTWPGYVTPHVTIFLILAMVMVVAWPASIMYLGGPHSWGVIAVIASWFAVVGWCAVTLWNPLTWPALAFYLAVVFGYVNKPLAEFFSGRHEPLALAVIAGAMVAIGGALIWLLRLTEENPAYHRSPQLSGWSLRARMTGDLNQNWKQAQSGWLSRKMQPQGICVVDLSAGLWARARRWRSLFPANLKFIGLMGAALIAGSFAPQWFNPGNSNTQLQMLGPLMWVFFMPAVNVSQLWLRQWRYLEIESLRPIERSEFLKELGLALAIQLFQVWAVLAVAAIGAHVLLSLVPPRLSLLNTAALVIESFLQQVFLFGVLVWFLRFRSPMKVMLPCMLAAMPVGVLIMVANDTMLTDQLRFSGYRAFLLPGILALAGVGVLIARNGYQKWLKTELG